MNVLCNVDALAGAGKTYALVHHAHDLVRNGLWVLMVMPTIALIEEVRASMATLSAAVQPVTIHHESACAQEGRVVAAIMTELKRAVAGGRVLLITWSAFEGLPFFPGRERWSVFVDEIPQAARMTEIVAPETHAYITDNIEIREQGSEWSRVVVKSPARLRKVAQTEDRSLSRELAPLARTLLSPHWTTYVRTKNFYALLRKKTKKLTFHSVLRPRVFRGFHQATVLGANIGNSLMYKLFAEQGALFQPLRDIAARLRYEKHPNGHLIRIRYVLDGTWSKRVRDRQDKLFWRRWTEAVGNDFGNTPFAWLANKDAGDRLFASELAVALPQVSNGLNCYQHLDNLFYGSARLPPPDHFAFLNWKGIDEMSVRRAIHEEAAYQTAMRCSIRDLKNDRPKTVVVPDRATAEYLHDLFPGSILERMTVDMEGIALSRPPGRRKVHVDSASRTRAHRRKRTEAWNDVARMMTGRTEGSSKEIGVEACETHLASQPDMRRRSHGSVCRDLYSDPIEEIPPMPHDDFVQALHQAHKTASSDKSDNMLISPALFDPDLVPETRRGLGNVVSVNGIWLDFEDGDLTHADLANIHPTVRLVAYNSYNSTRMSPRFRVYIPTSRAMITKEYQLIVGQVLQSVKQSGFTRPKKGSGEPGQAHGLDLSKRHAASLFYLPCQPRDAAGKIWKDYKTRRKPLDVDNWLKYASSAGDEEYLYQEQPMYDLDIVDDEKVSNAMDRWRTVGVMAGNGDAEMFSLAVRLRSAGLTIDAIESRLLEAAANANSPRDRVRQAKAIVRSWRRAA